MSVLIQGGRLIDPASGRDEVADLLIRDGVISEGGTGEADEVIEASGHWVLPGLVDLSARLGEPGYSHRGTIAGETAAAASAGITTLGFPPDCRPVLDSAASARNLHERLVSDARVRVRPIGALTRRLEGEALSDMHALALSGCAGVGNALAPIRDTRVLRNALQYAASLDLTVHLHPSDPWLAERGLVHEGRTATRHGLPGIPAAAEISALARDLALVADTGARAHFGRLSCARSAALIAEARNDGLPVTADVAMHQLFLTEHDVTGFDARCHVLPPLRTESDRVGLRRAVVDGHIDAICSDHTPLERDAKLAPFGDTLPGISALETLLALGLRLVDEELLGPLELMDRISRQPSRILGEDRGQLAVGSPADVILVDPEAVWTLDRDDLVSHARSTPFEGWEFRGRVLRTWVDGREVYRRRPAAVAPGAPDKGTAA